MHEYLTLKKINDNQNSDFDLGTKALKNINVGTIGFLGLAQKGNTEGEPVLVKNIIDFFKKFGGYLQEKDFKQYSYLAYSLEQFFANGGTNCYVMRVAPDDAKKADNYRKKGQIVKFSAKNQGAWGNNIIIKVSRASKAKTQIIEKISSKKFRVKNANNFIIGDIVAFINGDVIKYNRVVLVENGIIELKNSLHDEVINLDISSQKYLMTCEFNLFIKCDDHFEIYENLSLNSHGPNFLFNKLNNSNLIDVSVDINKLDKIKNPFNLVANVKKVNETIIKLKGGSNGSIEKISLNTFIGKKSQAAKCSGLKSYENCYDVSILAIPGVVDIAIQKSIIKFCEKNENKFVVLDIPRNTESKTEFENYRNNFDTDCAAAYHPWIKILDPVDKKNMAIPPSGSILGIYSRLDIQRGLHKAPVNEIIKNCVGLDLNYSKNEYELLETCGINLIRSFLGQGVRVWSCKTLSKHSSCKYINQKRLLIYLQKVIRNYIKGFASLKNTAEFYENIKKFIEQYLTEIWRKGVLVGNVPREAFYVEFLSNDKLIGLQELTFNIGISITKPFEFTDFELKLIEV